MLLSEQAARSIGQLLGLLALVETTREIVAKRPDYVQKFVDASILG